MDDGITKKMDPSEKRPRGRPRKAKKQGRGRPRKPPVSDSVAAAAVPVEKRDVADIRSESEEGKCFV